MVVLDTAVESELMRSAPDPAVVSWVAERAASKLYLTTITETELRCGLLAMAPDERLNGLAVGLESDARNGLREPRPAVRQRHGARLLPGSPPRNAVWAGLSRKPIARSRRSRCPAEWRWLRGAFGSSRASGSMPSVHGPANERTGTHSPRTDPDRTSVQRADAGRDRAHERLGFLGC